MYFYIGAVFGIFLHSKLVELILFRKVDPPKNKYFQPRWLLFLPQLLEPMVWLMRGSLRGEDEIEI